jgi:6-phosphogluconolactonase
MNPAREIQIFATTQELFKTAADQFASLANQAVQEHGRFTVALSGGSTPKGLFSLLATRYQSAVPWQNTFFFWGDERHVPPDDAQSNYRMAREALLSKLPARPENVFRMKAEDPEAVKVADLYEQDLRQFFALKASEVPRFDLILLGMGPDGHTASLFPGTAALDEKSRLVVANWVPKFNTFRLTMTLPVLNNAAAVTFLVAGADKADALHEVLEGSGPTPQFPSSLIAPRSGKLLWMMDKAAAARLSNSIRGTKG